MIENPNSIMFGAFLSGLVLGVVLGMIIQYFLLMKQLEEQKK